jgi:hypothetical protein
MTLPRLASVVLISGDRPVTSTVSDNDPISIFISRLVCVSTATCSFSCTAVRKPFNSTFTEYSPGGIATNRYVPDWLVAVVRTAPVSRLVSVTVAPGKVAPC